MMLDVCLGTKTAWRILFVLAEAPGKAITRKEIQALTKLGNKVLVKFLLILEKFEVITVNKIGRNYIYKLNLANPYAEQLLEIIKHEKKDLNNPDFKILNVLREFVYEITNVNLENIKHTYLFGSYAKRTYHKESDIDVAVITIKKDVNDELLITEVIEKIEKRFKKEIQPHYYTAKEFDELKKKKNKLVIEILKDGIMMM